MLSSPSNVILLTTKAEVALDNPALSLDSNLEQLIGVENVHATGDEGEVVAAAGNGELADEDAGGVPAVARKSVWFPDRMLNGRRVKGNLHIDAIAAAARRVNVTLSVSVNSIG
jgi:hypothetical protein